MSVFAYTALSKDGRRSSGTLASDSRATALSTLARQGLQPVSIDEANDEAGAVRKAQAAAHGTGRSPGVGHKAVESFTRELANLLAGGVPLSRAMGLLRRESSNAAAGKLWGEIHDDVVGGTSLADAMAKWPRTFSNVYVAMVRAGEAGGFLDVVLGQIADFRTRERDLKGRVVAAMIYPIILAVLAVAVLTFLLTFFIPKFQEIFSKFGASLPVLTKCIVAAAGMVTQYGLYVLGGIVAVVIILHRYGRTQAGRRKFEVVMLGIPVLGQVTAHFALVRFTRMLGTLVGAGVPLVASLRTAREAIGNQTLADTVTHAIEQVQRGSPLSQSLAACPQLFPASVIETIAVAEETARLDKELMRLAINYEAELDRLLRMLVAMAEPLMLFLMAAIIGTVVVGMLLPIFNLSDIVK